MKNFKEKSSAPKGTIEYEFKKLLNNSLYGKTIQATRGDKVMEVNGDGVVNMVEKFVASGLHNPVLASWTTGRVRARLHDLEEKYGSFHSSTDAIKAFGPVDETDIGGLGGIKPECRGDCLILRPKLYIHLDQARKVAKYALHGFQGELAELRRGAKSFLSGKEFEYFVNHCWSARQALTMKGKVALNFETRRMVLRPRLITQGAT
jgi:hypothetical protein